MAQRRMISKSISTSTKLAEVTTFSKLLFTWAVPHCDDYGHMDGTAKIVKGVVVPLCDETVEQVESSLKELERVGLISRYEVDGKKYLEISKFSEHQTLKTDRPKYKAFPWKPEVSDGKPEGAIVPLKLSEVKLSEVKLSEGGLGDEPPATKTRNFFNFEETDSGYNGMINHLQEKYPNSSIDFRVELRKFRSYWTEKNKSGKKERWELQPTFEVQRRLATWLNRANGNGRQENKYQPAKV